MPMQQILDLFNSINHVVWIWIGLTLLIVAGIWLSIRIGFFQFIHVRHWLGQTIGQVTVKKANDTNAISPFQALCTALAASIGVGNIAGVATAIATGGPGAIFWMWVAAILGMMTGYAESVLGIYYRRRGLTGWHGGAMYYIQDGLGGTKGRLLAILFAIFTVFAAFGIGNMAQVNAITAHLESLLPLPSLSAAATEEGISLCALLVGGILTLIVGILLTGGLQRTATVAEKIVPPMILLFTLGSLVVIGINHQRIGGAFAAIFRYAFTPSALWGAGGGIAIRQVVACGFKRGMFSNEAGMGSSVMVHANADVTEPAQQGMWSIFQVFIDTIVMCTITALVVLTGGLVDLSNGTIHNNTPPATLVSATFESTFGPTGKWFVTIAVILFAFTTILGWSQYGAKAAAYLGGWVQRLYKPLFLLMIGGGSLLSGPITMELCDIFNGLMMIPNLMALLCLSKTVKEITDNYVKRRIHGQPITPMLSIHPRIQYRLTHQNES